MHETHRGLIPRYRFDSKRDQGAEMAFQLRQRYTQTGEIRGVESAFLRPAADADDSAEMGRVPD